MPSAAYTMTNWMINVTWANPVIPTGDFTGEARKFVLKFKAPAGPAGATQVLSMARRQTAVIATKGTVTLGTPTPDPEQNW